MTSLGSKSKMTEAAEKSPSVHYANWKEDILLKKQLHVLNRSEKNVIHRIRIEQKVLFKRFQDKLYRSKLCEARMNGNKESERELRRRNLHGLNTDFGSTEKDYEFLTKLQRTRNNTHDKTVNQTKRKKNKKQNLLDIIVDEVFDEQPVVRRRSNSVSEGMRASGLNVIDHKSLGLPPITIAQRPATSSGTVSRRLAKENIIVNGDSANTQNVKKNEKNAFLSPFASTSRNYSSGELTKESETESVEKVRNKSSSFFEDEQKVDVVQIQLNRMKSLNYESKLNEFYETLEPLSAGDNAHRDYYMIRLQAAIKEISHLKHDTVPGTPEDEYDRHVGNLQLRSLTFKSLNYNFSRRDHAAVMDNFRPDVAEVAVSSDESSDDDGDDLED